MYLTGEGQEKGEKRARKAIWGNVPSDIKGKIKGGLEALTSGQFIALWTERVDSFMARKVEPPESLRGARQQGQKTDEGSRDRQEKDEGRCGREKEDLGSVAANSFIALVG